MENFSQNVMPYINFILTFVVGVILWLIIKGKNHTINDLEKITKVSKDALELFDINKIKNYTDLVEKTVKMEYDLENNQKEIIDLNVEMLDIYNELMNFEIHNLMNMSDEMQQAVLNSLPKNKRILEKALKSMKEAMPPKIV